MNPNKRRNVSISLENFEKKQPETRNDLIGRYFDNNRSINMIIKN